MLPDDESRISEFRKALRQYAPDEIIDLDKNYTYKFDFQIHRYENVLKNSKRTSPPNRWSYNRIGILTGGEGELTTGIYKFKAVKNTLVIIPSRMISSSKNWTMNTRGFILLFNADFFLQNKFSHHLVANKKILTTLDRPYIHLNEQEAEEVIRIFEVILAEKENDENRNNELIAIKIIELLILSERLFERDSDPQINKTTSDIIHQFADLLDQYVFKEHSVRFYADKMLLHPNHFNALIKKHTGISAKESIQNRLLLEIKYLLHSTELSIKEISTEMGFRDPNYFTTFFKRSENVSPLNYRSLIS
jgi:AraC family transcriptional regulator, transcriptional activator of pobA